MLAARLNESRTVLVIDGEPANRKRVSSWLLAAGYRCLQAGSAVDARRCLQSDEVHLATLGVLLPDEPPLVLLAELKSDLPELPVLMLTVAAQRKTAIKAMATGACGYVTRPVQQEELLAQIERGLEWRHLWLARKACVESLDKNTRLICDAHEESIHRLVAATMCRDEETGAHIVRTGLLSEALAKAVGWTDAEAESLRSAAPLHDIGKIGIPDAILQKPGRLTKDEYRVMQQHTVIGARLLMGSQSPVIELARQIALNHHERWDGTGYPSKISGDEIPPAARIVSIVDVYDALTHDRVYRRAFSEQRALSMMRAKQGTHFDPLYLTTFLKVFDQIHEIAQRNPDELPSQSPPSGPAPYANVALLDKFIPRLFDPN